MASMTRQIQANNDKTFLLNKMGKKAKHRCPVCHRFTLWVLSKDGKRSNCYWCLEAANDKLLNKAKKLKKLGKEIK